MAKTLSDITLADLLPSSIAADKTVEQTAAAIDPELQDAVNIANHLPFYSQIDQLSGEWVDQLAWQWHADAYEQARTLEERRYMAQNALLLHRWKGTPWAVKTALKTLGFQYVEIKEHWQLNSPPYTFAVRAGPMTENHIDFARRLIFEYKPTRSQLLWIDFSFWLIDEEQPDESFAFGIGVQPKETEAAAESVSPALSPDINESVWPRARYSDPGLFYDGEARYDSQTEGVELLFVSSSSTVLEQEISSENILSVLKIIV